MFHIHVETCNLSGIILAFKFPRVRAWFNLSQEGFVFHFWNLLRQNELFPFNKMRRQVLFPSPIIYTLSRKFFKAKSNKMILINWKNFEFLFIQNVSSEMPRNVGQTNDGRDERTNNSTVLDNMMTSYTTSHVLVGFCVSSFLPYTVTSVEIIFSCTCTIPRT